MYYEMLFGDVPWIGRTEFELTHRVLSSPLAFKGQQVSKFSINIL